MNSIVQTSWTNIKPDRRNYLRSPDISNYSISSVDAVCLQTTGTFSTVCLDAATQRASAGLQSIPYQKTRGYPEALSSGPWRLWRRPG